MFDSIHRARRFTIGKTFFCTPYSYFEKGCRKKKSTKVHATRPKGGLDIHWNFAHWPKGNKQVCIFAREELVFLLGGLICSFTFTVVCLGVRKILLKFSMAKCTLFPSVWRKRKRTNSRQFSCRYISLVFTSSTCSSSIPYYLSVTRFFSFIKTQGRANNCFGKKYQNSPSPHSTRPPKKNVPSLN